MRRRVSAPVNVGAFWRRSFRDRRRRLSDDVFVIEVNNGASPGRQNPQDQEAGKFSGASRRVDDRARRAEGIVNYGFDDRAIKEGVNGYGGKNADDDDVVLRKEKVEPKAVIRRTSSRVLIKINDQIKF